MPSSRSPSFTEDFFIDLRKNLSKIPTNKTKHSHNRKIINDVFLRHQQNLPDSLIEFVLSAVLPFNNSSARNTYLKSERGERLTGAWLRRLHIKICKNCKSSIKSSSLLSISNKSFCSLRCVGLSKELWEKRINTCMVERGVEYASQDILVKAKKVETNRENRGVDNPSQCPKIKATKIETTLKHFGVANPAQSQIVQNKIKKTSMKRWGTERPSQSAKVKQKQWATNMKKFGAGCPLHNLEVAKKAQWAGYKVHSITLEGKKFDVQGKYELRLLPLLVKKFGKNGVVPQFSKKFPRDDSYATCGYTPDFYIPSKKLFIEVKSTWTLLEGHSGREFIKNREKARTAGKKLKWVIGLKSNSNSWYILPSDWYLYTKKEIERLLKNAKA